MNHSHDQPKKESGSTDENATESTPAPAAVTTPNLICSFCDKKLPLDKYKKCNCKTAFYCMNASCQKEHWKVHKTEHRKLCKALNAVKNEGEKDDDSKSGSKNKTASPTIQPKPIQKEEKDECPICLDNIPLDASKFTRFLCCGKGLHNHCAKQLDDVKSKNIREYCPLCRTKRATTEKENIKRLQKWVKKKKAWAQSHLGCQYFHGVNGVKQDVKHASVLLKLAAEQGDANAQYTLGNMYRKGDGTKPDIKRAFELYTLSAEQGLASAQYNLSAMYANGEGVEESFTTAREWCAKAAAQGYEEAIAALQHIDEHIRRTTATSTNNKKQSSSNTTQQDDNDKKSTSSSTTTQQRDDYDSNKKESTNSGGNDDTSSTSSSKPKDILHDDHCSICFDDVSILDIKTFMQCTECGKVMHKKCADQLLDAKDLSYETRHSCPMCRAPNVAEGSKEQIERLQRWSQRNRSWAQFHLGTMYSRGLGVNKDPKRAFALYKSAADQGHHHAQFNLAGMYATGRGVIQSDELSLKYYMLSAEQGYARAQDHVGFYYANGTGVEQSNIKAREWWTKAAKQGQEDAIDNLKQLDEIEGIKTTSSSNFTDNSTVLCSKCNKPAQTNRTLRSCKCKGAQYCNNTCYHAHWKEHKPEHNRLVQLLPSSTGETKEEPTEDKKKTTDENKSKTKKQKPNDRCACGSKKKFKKCCGFKKR
jgi:TPR repeat protein